MGVTRRITMTILRKAYFLIAFTAFAASAYAVAQQNSDMAPLGFTFGISYKDAKHIIEVGGAESKAGKESIVLFDRKLREYGNDYNPGTTADITAATLALCILEGYRP